MGAIQDILRLHAPRYLERFGSSIPREHRKVIEAIEQCRSSDLGCVCYRCEHCEQLHVVGAACGNRHCPQCQHRKSMLWMQRQLQRQLPGPHFMLTFTVPEPLRPFLRSHQRIGYAALFEASAGAIKKLVCDSRFVGGNQAGFFGVLHTWGRQLQYHPHIHYVVPGGALSSQDGNWHGASAGFFLPVRALAPIVRAKFRDRIAREGFIDRIPPEVWTTPWNVHCQPVPDAEASIRYLAPYVFKVAISDHRILRFDERTVTFSYRHKGSTRLRTLELDALEFIRRFLQHVLPTGFMKVRYYGFLSPTAKVSLQDVRTKVELAHGFAEEVPEIELPKWPAPACQACGGALRFVRSLRTYSRSGRSTKKTGPPGHAAASG
jgi:hypothetical protein